MEIIRHDMCKHFARVTEYNGVLYFTGHIAAGKQPTMTEQMVALTPVSYTHLDVYKRQPLHNSENIFGVRSTLTNFEPNPVSLPRLAIVKSK